MACDSRWQPGEPIAYREVWRGRAWTARPVTLVRDMPEPIPLDLANGVDWQRPQPLDGGKDLFPC